MSPETHLLASWLIAAKTTSNPRDCRLVALAGILPDLDGAGLIVDVVGRAIGHPTDLYQHYHHWLLHGASGAFLIAVTLGGFARERWRVGLLAFALVHLHLLCDLVGSRGPTLDDFWPIHYLGPFSTTPVWIWKGQWRLDGWQNRYLSVGLFAWAFWLATKRTDSVVGVFNRRADSVFLKVIQQWRSALVGSSVWKKAQLPPWRTILPSLSVLGFLAGSYALWQPGLDVRDGQNDHRHNGIWISHGWLGGDEWFREQRKTSEPNSFRTPERIRDLAKLLRSHHITDIFPHLCPSDPKGQLPAMDDSQAERFLDEFSGFRVMPWIGGHDGSNVRFQDSKWRATFIDQVSNLFAAHPRFAGVHLNIEPLPSGDPKFLTFLEELHAALPKSKRISVCAYPPPTWWDPNPDLHWDESYFREVARRSDQMVVMLYDTSLRSPKLYRNLTADWTSEALSWSGGKPVLLGIPTYNDAAAGYHHPEVENMRNALLGIHQGLAEQPFSRSYQGIALYREWETDETEWAYLRSHFLKP
ncbi:MAG: glycosyl hydrolase family 18 protein [Verrucomicrobiota bacterium]